MKYRTRFLVAGLAAMSGAAVMAQPKMRPGLWEESVSIKTDDAKANAAMEQMKARLAAMPPDQRAAIEKMMASGGLGISPGGAPNVVRVCYTKEQLDRGFTPGRDSNNHCSRTNVSTSGDVVKFDFACTSGQHAVTGHGTIRMTGDTAFAFSSVSDSAGDKGTMHMQNDIVGKFVSSDCGDVKPLEIPPAK